MRRTSFMYVLIEERRNVEIKHISQFHLIDSDEFLLLRAFMALQYFPSTLFDLLQSDKPFSAAMERRRKPPQFRKILPTAVHPRYWEEMLQTPAVIIMTGNAIPEWLPKLSEMRGVGLLTSSQQTLQKARSLTSVSAGLLKGFADIREFYRVVGELIERLKPVPALVAQIPEGLLRIDTSDLLALRPRLDFIDYLPSPQPWAGRSAAILYNRLSNAAEETSLLDPNVDINPMLAPAMLNWATAACGVLMAREHGVRIPGRAGVKPREVNQLAKLLRSPAPSEEKFHHFMNIGRKVSGQGDIRRPFLTVPVPRLDILRKPTEGMNPDLVKPLHRRMAANAISDFLRGEERSKFESSDAKDVYVTSQHTILQEQRLLACEAVWLSSIDDRVPIQLRPFRGEVPDALRNFGNALANNSKKSTELFQALEIALAESLPPGVVDSVFKRASSVTLFSDYPYEWTLIEDRPLCLYRPTARVPLSMNSWYNISASLLKPCELTSSNPGNVLMLDLIEKEDKIRPYSDNFIRSSANIENKFTRASPNSAQEARQLIQKLSPEIVLIDGHGRYEEKRDLVSIQIDGRWCAFNDLLPDPPITPVWIVSACETAPTEALRGCVVRSLLSRGAYTVVATVARVDAFIASMLAGRLLADVYQPLPNAEERSFLDIFFATQLTTALIYDPLLPLLHKAEKDPTIRDRFNQMRFEIVHWFHGKPIDLRTFHEEIGTKLSECLVKYDLYDLNINLRAAGHVRPETLFFSIYGFPDHVKIAP
jgi:hypothetical protein